MQGQLCKMKDLSKGKIYIITKFINHYPVCDDVHRSVWRCTNACTDWLGNRNMEMQWGRDGSIWRGKVLRPNTFPTSVLTDVNSDLKQI
jgi:hypothetical protein